MSTMVLLIIDKKHKPDVQLTEKSNLKFSFKGTLFHKRKERSSDTYYNMDESLKHARKRGST